MGRHDRAYGVYREPGRKGGNKRRIPTRFKARKKVYGETATPRRTVTRKAVSHG